MIDAVLKLILVVFVLSMIIFPVYVNLFKERLWEYVKQKLEEQEKHDKLVKNMKSYIAGTYSSRLFRKGLSKKCGYMLAVILAVQLDKLTGDTGALRGAMILFSLANEGTSIIENLGEVGIPFPAPIVNAIAALKKKSDDSDN